MNLLRKTRQWARSPGFFVLTAGTLALGVAATTAIFAFVEPVEVLGVLEPELAFPRLGLDAWIVMQLPATLTTTGIFGNTGLARLAPGKSVADTEADLSRLIAEAESLMPDVERIGRLAELGASALAATARIRLSLRPGERGTKKKCIRH